MAWTVRGISTLWKPTFSTCSVKNGVFIEAKHYAPFIERSLAAGFPLTKISIPKWPQTKIWAWSVPLQENSFLLL